MDVDEKTKRESKEREAEPIITVYEYMTGGREHDRWRGGEMRR